MIDDSSLTQVFATVLAGVLIFLTLERRLGSLKESNDEIRTIDMRLASLRQDVLALTTERDYLIQTKDKTVRSQSDLSDVLHKQKVAGYEIRIQEKEEQIQRKTGEVNEAYRASIYKKARVVTRVERYTDLKTKEGVITLST